MKDLLKKLGGVVGTEEVVDRAADEVDKVYPGLSRKLLVTIVAASLGALTTWAMTLDSRVYALQEALLLKQTILENRDQLDRLENRLNEKALISREYVIQLSKRIEGLEAELKKHLEKTK